MPYYSILNNPILPGNLIDLKGVYILYALNLDKTQQPINRVLATDEDGVLYIGQTTKQTFRERLEMFRRVMNPAYAATAHSGALNLKEIPALRLRFPPNCIYVQVFPCENPKEEEQRIIEAYRQKFGEVPPLNGSK